MKSRKTLAPADAPQAIGPYSPGIVTADLVFASGSIGIDRATGKIVAGGIQAETRQALKNLRAILQAGGSDMDRVLKTTVFLEDIQEFGQMNEVYAEFFPVEPPARSTVAVAGLPAGARVEIEAIALIHAG
jgi:2-iminobutanoate/2-iminopropanoate deaminase